MTGNCKDIIKQHPNLVIKEDRVVYKRYGVDNEFLGSIVVPTERYPLNGPYRIFCAENTEQIEDKEVLSIFNEVKYQVGRCYGNTEAMQRAFCKKGKKLDTYVGWLFLDETQLPIHHCWGVYKEHVIDLADDLVILNQKLSSTRVSEDTSMRKLVIRLQSESQKLRNSERCWPVGKVSKNAVYVGSLCSPDKGRTIYQGLEKKFPEHHRKVNLTQALMSDMGLMN